MTWGKGESARGRSVIRRSVSRFAALSMLALVILGVGTVVVSRDIAQDEARREAENRATGLAHSVAAPLVGADLRAGTPGAAATLEAVLRNRITEGSVQHIKLWATDGTVIWADRPDLIGKRFRQPAAVQALYGTHDSTAELSDLDEPENVDEAAEAPLLEVYVGSIDADGTPFVFETYTSPARVDQDRTAVLRRLLPLDFATLVLFEAAVLALAYFLARDVDRAQRHRGEIIERAAASWHLERRRLAQDLHDGVIQDLAAVSYALPGVLERIPDDDEDGTSRATGDRIVGVIQRDVAELRSLISDLYPADLSADGLRAAINGLLPRVAGVHVTLEVEDDLAMSAEAAGLSYRVVREALGNIERHAAANRAWVRVARVGDIVLTEVTDDGRGFGAGGDPAVSHNGLHLLGDVLHDAGGSLILEEREGGGAIVASRIPADFGGAD